MSFFKSIFMSIFFSLSVWAQMPGTDLIATGAFKGSNFLHKAQGQVSIIKMNQSLYLNLDSNFSVTKGPDLFLMLRNSKDNKAGMPILATLKQYSGSQMFKLEISQKDLTKYDQVIIYCKRFSTLFGFAVLEY